LWWTGGCPASATWGVATKVWSFWACVGIACSMRVCSGRLFDHLFVCICVFFVSSCVYVCACMCVCVCFVTQLRQNSCPQLAARPTRPPVPDGPLHWCNSRAGGFVAISATKVDNGVCGSCHPAALLPPPLHITRKLTHDVSPYPILLYPHEVLRQCAHTPHARPTSARGALATNLKTRTPSPLHGC
jgi:hypothetical protein